MAAATFIFPLVSMDDKAPAGFSRWIGLKVIIHRQFDFTIAQEATAARVVNLGP